MHSLTTAALLHREQRHSWKATTGYTDSRLNDSRLNDIAPNDITPNDTIPNDISPNAMKAKCDIMPDDIIRLIPNDITPNATKFRMRKIPNATYCTVIPNAT